jgi:hypothetical protein
VIWVKALNELLFWKHFPCLKFDSDIWPLSNYLSIAVAKDARVVGLGGHNIGGHILPSNTFPLGNPNNYIPIENHWVGIAFKHL